MRTLELLAPAKDLECGIGAIDHGADAVYIGAPRFGARASAGNDISDISQLCQYAHQFGAKVYVTVNTIIYDNELDRVEELLRHLADVHVDAILVQDMSLLGLCPSQLALHASTQTDNRSSEKVAWLRSLGFRRVVLARELSIDEIAQIHSEVPDVELEVFVHGALCVSYSGLCYASQYCFKRSANRGECAQFCRMKFDLLDADGQSIERQRYLLSLKDMNQSANLEALAEAGATSFKIDGRLKDAGYVKNVTAAYSNLLNQLVAKYPNRYRRASFGISHYDFSPNLNKTFNRGYTQYFANGRNADITSFDTPKAIGQYVGKVKEIRGRVSFNVTGVESFANGDGLCFINDNHDLEGFRVNRVECNRLYPLKMPVSLRPGMSLYRNNDQEFERVLAKSGGKRKIFVNMAFQTTDNGFSLIVTPLISGQDSEPVHDVQIEVSLVCEHQIAQKPPRENILRQLSKLGDTIYICNDVSVPADFNFFVPSSMLSELRHRAVAALNEAIAKNGLESQRQHRPESENGSRSLPYYSIPYLYNIANHRAKAFYIQAGLHQPSPAFEIESPKRALLMQCRHCLRFALGYCVKHGGKRPQWHEPLYLRLSDGKRFKLEFDCNKCQMNIYAEDC